MTKWLASIQSLQEAQTILNTLPDILDLKDPSKGALGALSIDNVAEIVRFIDKRCLVSATIGDLPMDAKLINQAILAMATTSVDYIKIGLFPDANLAKCINELASTTQQINTPIIAVLFADQHYDSEYLHLLSLSGFKGVMVDTAIKDGKSLRNHWSLSQLKDFISTAQQYNLLCGLAGALRQDDIPTLKLLGADYLGFRSALCQQHIRNKDLDPILLQQVRTAIKL